MRQRKRIRKVSKKQGRKNRELAEYKKTLSPICCICGAWGWQLMHLLPKSVYPQHYTEKKNLDIGCHECHELYDNDLDFRREQQHLYERICSFDERSANQYFQY